ncbi:MAG: ferredoxin [Polaromonas sp.]|nr:ferredoxin [Polaromonas sp.]
MALHTVTIEDDGSTYRCSDSLTLLEGMESLGRKGIPVGCRGGGCGVCKVQVLSGSYTKRVMSREHVSEEDEAQGRVLACRVRPTGPIALRVVGKMKKNVCRVVEPTNVSSPSQLDNKQETTQWQ